MRPIIGADVLDGKGLKPGLADVPVSCPSPAGPGPATTFFLAREDQLNQDSASGEEDSSDNNFGVQSLEEAIDDFDDSAEKNKSCDIAGRRDRSEPERGAVAESIEIKEEPISHFVESPAATLELTDSPCSTSRVRQLSTTSSSTPLTPLMIPSPVENVSVTSSPKSTSSRSFRQYDDSMYEDGSSPAALSASEDGDVSTSLQLPEAAVHDNELQFIMPRIKMPSRRPFTNHGKSIGRFKVLVAGNTGVGKTSLIKAIVQTCEDIVHVDPLTPTQSALFDTKESKSCKKMPQRGQPSTIEVTEIYASTKPYPHWWSNLESTSYKKKRKSFSDTVLERNVCFVDTPGYTHNISLIEGVETTVRYIESQMVKTNSAFNNGGSDLFSMIGGDGGSQVDAVLYLLSGQIQEVDIESLRRITPLTNVIILITKSDLTTPGEMHSFKREILNKLQAANVEPFLFGKTFDELQEMPEPEYPYAISSANVNDLDCMDASLLMSSEYIPRLASSDLNVLISRVFQKDTIDWLRHSAAKKFMDWRRQKGLGGPSTSTSLHGTLHTDNRAESRFSRRPIGSSYLLTNNSTSTATQLYGDRYAYSVASFLDYSQHEERLAQVRLSKWAANLQKSLQNEKKRYERIAAGERALWLTERLGECVLEGTLVPVPRNYFGSHSDNQWLSATASKNGRVFNVNRSSSGLIDPRDPLGLMHMHDIFRRRCWLALELLGSVGILGGLALFLAKHWGMMCEGSFSSLGFC